MSAQRPFSILCGPERVWSGGWCAVRCGALVFMAAMALLFSGCRNMAQTADEEVTRVGAILNARRPASLRDWRHKSIDGENVRGYVLSRTALLVPPNMTMTVRMQDSPDHVRRYDALFTGRGTVFFAGSAVPLTSDGYFLTASHCLDDAVPGIVAINGDGELRSATSRVVWRGHEREGDPDLALLHAPLAPVATLRLAGLPGPEKGSAVLTAGFGSHGFPDMRAGVSGGQVLHLGPIRVRPNGARWREIAHSAPTAQGDSGGPVIDAKGRLQAITTELRGWRVFMKKSDDLWFYRGIAMCPDAEWIQSLIDMDRAGGWKGAKR
jgi:S1-C subfamily serine protease